MRFCILLTLAIGCSAVAAQENPVKEELKKLEGKWVRVSFEADGRSFTDKKDSPQIRVTIIGEKWIEMDIGGAGEATTFKINPTENPKHIDFIMKAGKGRKDDTFAGIYKLEGDTLTTAEAFPFEDDFSKIGKRPTVFRTKRRDGFVVTVYQRIKP